MGAREAKPLTACQPREGTASYLLPLGGKNNTKSEIRQLFFKDYISYNQSVWASGVLVRK